MIVSKEIQRKMHKLAKLTSQAAILDREINDYFEINGYDIDELGDYLYYEVEYSDVVKWQTDDYRKKLKKAVEDIGITSPVSSHSLRKSFGYWIHKTHPFDPDCLLSLQKLFNHSDLQTTMNYIGLTEEKNRQLINDHGEFIHNVLAGKGDEIVKNMPVISLKSDDFGKIIRMLTDDVDKYQKAIDMANEMRIL